MSESKKLRTTLSGGVEELVAEITGAYWIGFLLNFVFITLAAHSFCSFFPFFLSFYPFPQTTDFILQVRIVVTQKTEAISMVPQIASWDDLSFVSEECDHKSGQFLYTSLMVIDETDTFYYGRLKIPKAEVTFDIVTHALKPVSDNEIFSKWPASGMKLTEAPEAHIEKVHIKRPALDLYETLKEYNQLHQLSGMLLAEAQVMEMLCQHPHPNIIRYYGCRVVRGHMTGLVMDKHTQNLDRRLY